MSSKTHCAQVAPETRPSAIVIPFRKPVRIPVDLKPRLERMRAELGHVFDGLPADLHWTEAHRMLFHARWHFDAAIEALAKIQGGRGHE